MINKLTFYLFVFIFILILCNIVLLLDAYNMYKINKANNTSNKTNYLEFITGIPVLIIFCIMLYKLAKYIFSQLPRYVSIAIAVTCVCIIQMVILYKKLQGENPSLNVSTIKNDLLIPSVLSGSSYLK